MGESLRGRSQSRGRQVCGLWRDAFIEGVPWKTRLEE